jgi:hypothetical protein
MTVEKIVKVLHYWREQIPKMNMLTKIQFKLI